MTAPRTKQEFRRFVAEHHPDRGGDPEHFARVVAAWRSRQAAGPPVVFYRRRSRRARLLQRLRALLTPARPTERRVR